MFDFGALGQASASMARPHTIQLLQSPRGLNTVLNARDLGPDDLVEATNFKLIPGAASNILHSRPGLLKVTTATTTGGSAIKTAAYIPLAGTWATLLVDASHRLYKCTGSEPTLDPGSSVKTLEGEAQIVPFDDKAVILDGGYVKIYDGSTVSLAYDDGDGARARMVHASCETLDDTPSQDLYSGSLVRCGAQITTPAWTAGYTIPLTRAKFWLSKTGSPTGDITAVIYNSDGSSALATASTTLAATRLTTSAKLFEFTWPNTATQDLSPSTSYIIAILYSGGDASNYVTVHGYTEASGGDCYTYDGSSWSNVGTAGIALDVYPGRPPKASFGIAKAQRLYLAGDPDNEGRLWYSYAGTALDWSSEDGGGYVSAVDYSSNAFPIGGIVVHFGQILVFGKNEQPYLAILEGDSPSSYDLNPSFQQIYTNHKTVLSLPNDVWYVSGLGVQNIQGTEQHGDLRAFPASAPIHDTVRDSWDTDAFAGYLPSDGVYLLKLTGDSNLYACHVGLQGQPWCKWTLANSVTPHSFMTKGGTLYVGGSDGHLYKFDQDEHQDQDAAGDKQDLTFALKTGIAESPFGTERVDLFYCDVSRDVTSFKLDFYTNGGATADRTVDVTTEAAIQQGRVNVVGDSLQVGMDTFVITDHFTVRGIALKTRKLQRRTR